MCIRDRHWIDLKLFYLQPSELMKISLPMMMAWYLHREPLPPAIRTVLVAGALIALPTGLILLQPDFGTAMLVAASGVFALLLAGLPWWWAVSYTHLDVYKRQPGRVGGRA